MPGSQSNSTTVEAAYRSFILAERAAGKSPRTLGIHNEGVMLLDQRRPVAAITSDDVRTILANPRWANSTRLIRFKSLRAFFEHCIRERFIATSPMDGFQAPRGANARMPAALTEDEVRALMNVCPVWTWIGRRDRAILAVLTSMPARLSEITGMLVNDIDWTRLSVDLRGKGGVKYQAILFPDCATAIDKYLNMRPFDVPELWVNQRGEPLRNHALQQLLKRIKTRAGINKPLNVHSFRHRFGMKTVEWGLATDEAMHLLGHRSDAATKIYRQWNSRDMALEKVRRIADYQRR